MLAKVLVLIVIVAILASLFSALAMLFRKDGGHVQMVKALTVRISLSVGLFVLLMLAIYFGLIPHKGLGRF